MSAAGRGTVPHATDKPKSANTFSYGFAADHIYHVPVLEVPTGTNHQANMWHIYSYLYMYSKTEGLMSHIHQLDQYISKSTAVRLCKVSPPSSDFLR